MPRRAIALPIGAGRSYAFAIQGRTLLCYARAMLCRTMPLRVNDLRCPCCALRSQRRYAMHLNAFALLNGALPLRIRAMPTRVIALPSLCRCATVQRPCHAKPVPALLCHAIAASCPTSPVQIVSLPFQCKAALGLSCVWLLLSLPTPICAVPSQCIVVHSSASAERHPAAANPSVAMP